MKGSRSWRIKNRVFRENAVDLLVKIGESSKRPAIIYADPPYTKDQYSRYYHIYETLMLYDHPSCVGRGLYRPNRCFSDFCYASKVEKALRELVERSSMLRSDLIISYPTNGLLPESRKQIPSLIQKNYKRKPEVIEMPHMHSTMGASKGSAKQDVTEVLYMVQA